MSLSKQIGYSKEKGRLFSLGNQYGYINLTMSSMKGIVRALLTPVRWLFGYENAEEQNIASESTSYNNDGNNIHFLDAHRLRSLTRYS